MATNPNTKKVNTELQQAIESILTDRPIAYHAVLAKAVGSATAGIFLSQLLYWTPRAQDKDGWIYKTQEDIYGETALTRWEQETARKKLRSVGILVEKRAGVPSRLFFRIDMGALVKLLATKSEDSPDSSEEPSSTPAPHDVVFPHRTMRQTYILESVNPSNKNEEKPQTINVTENTTENTTESVVVGQALENFGISKSAANKLTQNFPEELIMEKLDLAQWLVSTGSPSVAKNPAGWLRKAIEEDYTPPRNYESSKQRKAKTEKASQLAKRQAKERQLVEAEYRRVKAEAKEQLLQEFPPTLIGEGLTTHTAWEQALQKLKDQVGVANYETWVKDTVLLEVTDRAAKIAAGSPFQVAWLERKLYPQIVNALKDVLKRQLDLQFITTSPDPGRPVLALI
jgi:hypothetical protein